MHPCEFCNEAFKGDFAVVCSAPRLSGMTEVRLDALRGGVKIQIFQIPAFTRTKLLKSNLSQEDM
jgi:hypothetical protein